MDGDPLTQGFMDRLAERIIQMGFPAEDQGEIIHRVIAVIHVLDDAQAYIELIKENISYEHHMKYDKYGQRELYDELFEVICEVVCVKRQMIRVAGEEYPYELVKSRFLTVHRSHLEYVIGCMKETTTKITNKEIFKSLLADEQKALLGKKDDFAAKTGIE